MIRQSATVPERQRRIMLSSSRRKDCKSAIFSLWMAILADTGATVLVTANALRLLRIKL